MAGKHGDGAVSAHTDAAAEKGNAGAGSTDNLVLAASSLGDIQKLNQPAGGAAVTEVQWKTSVEQADKTQQGEPKQLDKEGVSNNLAETISFKGHGPGADMRALRAFEPKLAKAIEGVATDLANRPAGEQQQILGMMKQMYDGMNPLKTDNRESAEALRKAKLDPAMVDGVRKRAEEVLALPENQRAKELQKIQKQFREFYLD